MCYFACNLLTDLFNLQIIFAVMLQISFDFGSSLMDEVMKSLGTSTADGSESAEMFSQQVRAVERPTDETKCQAEVATVQVVAGNLASPDAESMSDTESGDSDETSSSESTVSHDENCPADDAVVARSSQTASSPAVM